MRSRTLQSVVFFAALIALLVLVRSWGGGAAPRPARFEAGLTLASAESVAAERGGVVMVVATADWCGPCQSLKRGALADEGVAGWVRQHAAPVYLDLTAPGPEERAAAGRLGIGPIPAVILLRDGQEIARTVGATPPQRLLRWLEAAAGS
ncbi:MAG: thioredoxin family protein [Phycisphaerales bacterium JB039]